MTTTTPGSLATESHAEATPAGLVPYALGLVAAAMVALGFVAATYPVLPAIAIDGTNAPPGLATGLGVAFWVVFGIIGSVRPREIGGGAVITFHAPFVIAGTMLGGPVVGALMGVISVTELREIRRGPWYGVLANHATCVLAAVAAGAVGVALESTYGELLPSHDAARALVIGIAVAGTFIVMNWLLVIPVIAMRSGTEFGTVVRRATTILRVTLVAEVTLGWLMAVVYLSVAWWAPLVCVLVIIAVWDAHARHEELRRDPMTGLLNDAGMQPILEAAVEEARRQRSRHAVVFIDLDGFGKLNKQYGEDVGDEVIRAVARRLATAVRASDAVGRQNRAGDEFVILFRDLVDDELATRLAWRVHASILRPVRVRGASLEVAVGASLGIGMVSPNSTESLDHVKRIADERMQAIKRAGGGVFEEGASLRAVVGAEVEPDRVC